MAYMHTGAHQERLRAMRKSERPEDDTSSGEDCFGDVSERMYLCVLLSILCKRLPLQARPPWHVIDRLLVPRFPDVYSRLLLFVSPEGVMDGSLQEV